MNKHICSNFVLAKLVVLASNLIIITLLNTSLVSYANTTTELSYRGINIAGAEFNSTRKNAQHFKDYVWPSNKNLKEMKAFGFNTLRIPFAWERMQPIPFGRLNEFEAKQLDRIVQFSHQLGLYVVIDPHNYGKYFGTVLTTNTHDLRLFSNLWHRLAVRYGTYPNVIFGLMNEPYKQSAQDWAKLAQSGIDAIRKTGSEQLILVPGTKWSGMHSWLNGDSNANALFDINDPLENYAYEMHQYFDMDSSGTHTKLDQNCISSEAIIAKFRRTSRWLEQYKKKAFLGEFGAQENDSCIAALKAALHFMKGNSSWIGWTYWAASDWMADYPYNVFSKKNEKTGRIKLLDEYLK